MNWGAILVLLLFGPFLAKMVLLGVELAIRHDPALPRGSDEALRRAMMRLNARLGPVATPWLRTHILVDYSAHLLRDLRRCAHDVHACSFEATAPAFTYILHGGPPPLVKG